VTLLNRLTLYIRSISPLSLALNPLPHHAKQLQEVSLFYFVLEGIYTLKEVSIINGKM
jgi:hypothetical protein